MKYKKGKANWGNVILIVGVALVALAFLGIFDIRDVISGSGVPEGGDGDGDESVDEGQCAYQPTVSFTSVDKEDSSNTVSAVKYKVNDGAIQTDADGQFNVAKGSKLSMLLAYNNAGTYTPIVKEYTVDQCGLNEETFNELVQNTSITLQCFNEEGNPIDEDNPPTDNESTNETIGTGEAPTLKCELRGVAKKGFPLGGVLTAELSKSVYAEEDFDISGLGSMPSDGIFGNPVSQAQTAYTLSATDNTVKAYEVEPMVGAGVKTFYVYLPAEDDQNPNDDDVTLTFYPAAGYEEEDVSGGEFRQGITDLDNTFVRSPAGTHDIEID